jgi:hypothetical protein
MHGSNGGRYLTVASTVLLSFALARAVQKGVHAPPRLPTYSSVDVGTRPDPKVGTIVLTPGEVRVATESLVPVLEVKLPDRFQPGSIRLLDQSGTDLVSEAIAAERYVSTTDGMLRLLARQPIYPGDLSFRFEYAVDQERKRVALATSVTFIDGFENGFPVHEGMRYWGGTRTCKVFRTSSMSTNRFLRCWTGVSGPALLVFLFPWQSTTSGCFTLTPRSAQANVIVATDEDFAFVLGDAGASDIKAKVRLRGSYDIPKGCRKEGDFCQLVVGSASFELGRSYRISFIRTPELASLRVVTSGDGAGEDRVSTALVPLHSNAMPRHPFVNIQVLPLLNKDETHSENTADFDDFKISFSSHPICE